MNYKILFFLCVIGHSVLAQSYVSSRIEKCERYYEEGFYDKAFQKCKREIRMLERKQKDFAAAKVMLLKAKYLEGLARYDEFETTVNKALEILEKKGGHDYGLAMLEASYLYLLYGDMVNTERLLWQSQDLLKLSTATGFENNDNRYDDYTLYLLYFIESKINLERGDFERFWELYEPLKKIADRRIVKKETYLENGQPFSRNLDPFQFRRRKSQYAQVLTMAGIAHRSIGDYVQSQKTLEEAQDWILSNLSRFSMAYVNNYRQLALVKIESGGDLNQAKKMLEKAIFNAERIVQTVHKDFLVLHEDLIEYYAESRYIRKGKYQQWVFDKNTKMFFGSDSPPHFIAKRLQAKLSYNLYPTRGMFESVYRNLIELKNDINQLPLNHYERVKTLELLYNVSISSNRIQEAGKHLDELLSTKKVIFGESSLTYKVSLAEKASYLTFYSTDFKTARNLFEKSYNQSLSVVLLPQNPILRSTALAFAEYYEVMGRYDSAKLIIEKVKLGSKEFHGNNHILYASALEREVNLDIDLGEFKLATTQQDSIQKILQKSDNRFYHYEQSRILATMARLDASMGLYDEAKRNLNRSQRFSSFTPIKAQSNQTIDEETELFINTGNFGAAQRLLDRTIAERIERYGEQSTFLIRPYGQKGNLLALSGEYVEAETYINKAYDLTVKSFGDSSIRTVESLRQKAELMAARGDYDNADELLQRILKIQISIFGENKVPVARTYNLMALVELNKGEKIEKVEELMTRSIEIIKNEMGDNTPAYALALKNLAIANTQSGKYDEAKKNLLAARRIWTKRLGSKNNTNVAEIEVYLADVNMREQVFTKALERYKNAAKTYRSVFSKTHPGYIVSIGRTARALYALKKYSKANKYSQKTFKNYYLQIDKFFPSLSDNEKNKFWSIIKPDFEFYYSLALASGRKKDIRKMYENAIATKSLLLSGSVKIRALIRQDSTLSAVYDRWALRKDSLSKSLSFSKQQLEEFGIQPKRLEKDIEQDERILSSRSSEFASLKDKIYRYKDIRKALSPKEIAVEIIRFRHFTNSFSDSVVYAALIVKPNRKKAPELVVLESGNLLESRAISYYDVCMQQGFLDKLSYGFFWKKLDDKLNDDAVVYLSPSGVYNQINIETLLDGETFMLDKNIIYLIGNTKDIAADSKSLHTSNKQAYLFGCPGYRPGLSENQLLEYDYAEEILQLPGTFSEIQTVDSILNQVNTSTVKKTFYDASEENIRQVKSPSILHIATHGFFIPTAKADLDADPALSGNSLTKSPLMRSGLLFANSAPLMEGRKVYNFNKEPGVLTAYDAMNLELQGTELVILSACQTAVGEDVGDGVYGLQRSFVVAGAEKIIMSLYEVDDIATQKLMIKMYKKWQGDKLPVRQAFIESKRELRKEFKEFKHPKYWGAFIMTGTK
jgi:CHAT domain-containing protein